jgi:CBS domain-containing protein/uncharacterized protein (DUF2267 family)
MRLWDERAGFTDVDRARDYEVVGYVLAGRAELSLEGQMVVLAQGDSYVVPRGARHHYRIIDDFRAIEATSPPAHVRGRDLAPGPTRWTTVQRDLTAYCKGEAVILSPDATAYDAARAMAEQQIGAVIIGERNRIVGIVSDRDLALNIVASGAGARETPVTSIMRKPVATIDVHADVGEVAAVMCLHSCRRLPVTDGGRLVGIVTLDDLLMGCALDPDMSASVVSAQVELAKEWKKRNREQDGQSERTTVLGRHVRALKRHRSRASSTYHRLVRDVEKQTGLRTKDAAETVLLIVLDGICRRIPPMQADHVLAQLSSIARGELEPLAAAPDKKITKDAIKSELKAQLHTTDEHATTVLSAVCAVIAQHISMGLVAAVRSSLPADLRELFPACSKASSTTQEDLPT